MTPKGVTRKEERKLNKNALVLISYVRGPFQKISKINLS